MKTFKVWEIINQEGRVFTGDGVDWVVYDGELLDPSGNNIGMSYCLKEILNMEFKEVRVAD